MTKTTAPQVTVLMSCYNAVRWLDEAITSVLTQSFGDFEFIVVDDGSTDETLKLVRRVSELDSRIVVVEKPNTGLADSLNVGIQKACGEWIARLDADDVCEPTRLEKQIAHVRDKPRVVFVGSGLVEIDADGNRLKTHRYPPRHAALLEHLRTARKFPPHSSAFYRTKAARVVGGYRSRIRRAQDWDLWLRLSEVGELACLPDPLVMVRKHADQISHEDTGKRQIVDSRVAITSYFLRRCNFSDPVGGEESAFEAFRVWLGQRLDEEGLFEFERFSAQLGASFRKAPNVLVGGLEVGKAALRHPFRVMNLLRQRLGGIELPRRLAGEWMDLPKDGAEGRR